MNKEVIEIDTNSILYTHLKERTLIEFNHWGIDIDEKELTPKTNLKNLGLDSLDIAMIIFETEIDFGMDIPEEIWKNCKTLGDIYLGFIKGRYAEDETN
jgi:acyl carrier protein